MDLVVDPVAVVAAMEFFRSLSSFCSMIRSLSNLFLSSMRSLYVWSDVPSALVFPPVCVWINGGIGAPFDAGGDCVSTLIAWVILSNCS